MANNTIKRVWKQAGINIEDLSSMLFQAESGGHTFAISGVDADGNPVALSGTPAGVFLRPDNTDVALTCSVSNGVVYATLPAECYAVQGRGGVTIFLTSGGQKSAIYAAVVSIGKTTSGNVSPGTTASVVDLINAINAAIAQIPASDTNLKAAMAPTYSTSAVYAVGDYAWNNGVLYRCTTAITSGETWTSGHWTAAAIGSDSAAGLRDLKSAFEARFNALRDYYLKSFSSNLYNPEAAIVGEVNPATGAINQAATSRFVSDYIPVEPSTQYTFALYNSQGSAYAYNKILCARYDANKNVIPGTVETISTITTESTCKYMRVSGEIARINELNVVKGGTPGANTQSDFMSFYDYIINKIGIENIAEWIDTNDESITEIVDAFVRASLTSNLYNSASSSVGRVYPPTGEIFENSSWFASDYIPVEPNTQYTFCYFDSLGRTNLYSMYCGCYTSDKEVITGSDSRVNTITTAATCAYIRISGEIARRYEICAIKGGTPANGSYEPFSNFESVVKDKLNKLNGTRQCVINFQFDDGLANDSLIFDIFTAANRVCGFALISSIVNNQGSVDRYLGYQQNGFEMLSHSTDNNTPTTEAPMRESKAVLEGAGFNIRGWVTPASALGKAYRKWLRKYYDFAYTVYYGEHSDTNVDASNQPGDSEYNLQRVSLESTQTYALLTNAVDNAIASGGFLTFYAHSQYIDVEGHGAFTTENLTNLIAYIKGKEADGYCKLMKPSDCYDAYYKMRHDDLWLMLN